MKKLKIFKSKRAINDISIIAGIIMAFVLLGVLMPFVTSEFNATAENVDVDKLEKDIGDKVDNYNRISLNAFDIFKSVFFMFFWTFGALPFWLDAIFLVFRIILVVTISRNIWIGGGS